MGKAGGGPAHSVYDMDYQSRRGAGPGEDGQRFRRLQQETGCELAPVGENWWKYHREHPEEDMYAEDGQHASKIGSRVAASTIAETFLSRG